MLSQGVQLGTQVVGLVLLSRLLPPRAFGIVAMVSAVIGLANVLGGFGLSLSALAGRTPDQAERSNLFWMNAAAGLICMLAVAACGPLLASFYHQHALTGITAALAVPFLLGGLSVQFKIELNLAGRWLHLGAVQAVPSVVALAAAAVVAALTASYWALVLQSVLASALQLLLAVRISGWRPGRPQRDGNVRRHFVFGRDTVAVQTLNYIASNADNVLVGRVLGSTALGEYNRAYSLAVLPLQQISIPLGQIILPRLSAALDDGFDEAMLRCQRVMAYAQLVPISALVGTAYPLVWVFLGPRWSPVSQLIQILAIGAAASALSYIFWWVLLVNRRTGLFLVSEGPLEIAMTVAMALVVKYGSVSVAWCVSAGQTLILLASAVLCRRMLGIDLRALARVSSVPLALTVGSALAASAISRAGWWPNHVLALVAATLVWVGICGFAWLLSRHIRDDARFILGLLRPTPRVEATITT